MGKRLTTAGQSNGLKLQKKNERFILAIATKLDNGFEIKDMDKGTVKSFHRFVAETVGKELTVSEVDRRYLRKKDSNMDENAGKSIIHYGENRTAFRIFGYYDQNGYFVITRIDGKHKTHKS